MTERIRVADLREAANQRDYFLDAEAMVALLDVAEAAHRFATPYASANTAGDDWEALNTTLQRFDFSEPA